MLCLDRAAVEGGLWGPALILARASGDKAYAETTAAVAAATAGPGTPLSSLLLMLSGGHELLLPGKVPASSSPSKPALGSGFNLKGLLTKSSSKVRVLSEAALSLTDHILRAEGIQTPADTSCLTTRTQRLC